MDRTKYTLGYKFGEIEIFPKQKNDSTGTYLIRNSVLEEMAVHNLVSKEPNAMIIFRPNMRTDFISADERSAFDESGLPLLIIRNNSKTTLFTRKSLENPSPDSVSSVPDVHPSSINP